MGAEDRADQQSPAWEDIPAEKQQKILQLAEKVDEPAKASRREILAGLGLGAALGGGTGYALSEPASASHGGGSVGTSSNPVDVFANAVEIAEFSTGFDYLIYRHNGRLAAIDRSGEVVVGGPNALQVSDETDFAEVLTATVNNASMDGPAIKLAPSKFSNDPSRGYKAKTSGHVIEDVFMLVGPGKNRGNIETDASIAGSVVWEVNQTVSGNILRMDSIKFEGPSSTTSDHVGTYLKLTGVDEFIFTDCEFRDAQDWGIDASASFGWNYLTNCWFLEGAGYRFVDCDDILIIGGRVANSGTNRIIEDTGGTDAGVSDVMVIGQKNRQGEPAPDPTYTGLDSLTIYGEHVNHGIEEPTVVTSSRSAATTYQNTNDYNIEVYIEIHQSTSGSPLTGRLRRSPSTPLELEDQVDRVEVAAVNSDSIMAVKTVVPAGHYYELSKLDGSIVRWTERGYREL